jgi:hypothetical protein
MTMQIRRAEPADEEALATIRRSAILAQTMPAMSRELAERWATRVAADRLARAIRDHDVWVAVEEAALAPAHQRRVSSPARARSTSTSAEAIVAVARQMRLAHGRCSRI